MQNHRTKIPSVVFGLGVARHVSLSVWSRYICGENIIVVRNSVVTKQLYMLPTMGVTWPQLGGSLVGKEGRPECALQPTSRACKSGCKPMNDKKPLLNESSGIEAEPGVRKTIHVVCRDCPDLEELVSSDWTANALAFDHEQDKPDHTVAFGEVAE